MNRGAIGFDSQKALLAAITPWLPLDAKNLLDGRPLLRNNRALVSNRANCRHRFGCPRLLLVMSLALYFAVSTEQWEAVANFTVDEKNATPTAEKLSRGRLSWFTIGLRRIVRMVTLGLPLPPLWASG